MQLDDLTSLSKYNDEHGLTYRESLAKALANKIDIYYVFDGRSYVVFEPHEEDLIDKKDDSQNWFGSHDALEREFAPCDFILLTPGIIRDLWGRISYEDFKVKLRELIEQSAPDGYHLSKMLDGESRLITIDNLYADTKKNSQLMKKGSHSDNQPNSSTALKVIGLLMHHLAKSPKYASGTSPNKSQIKELLLELAVELDINNYGLSKVDERLLAEAMKYLETQKN